jgi:homospermidine synthase
MHLASELELAELGQEIAACGPAVALRVASAVLAALAEKVDDAEARVRSTEALEVVIGVLAGIKGSLASAGTVS